MRWLAPKFNLTEYESHYLSSSFKKIHHSSCVCSSPLGTDTSFAATNLRERSAARSRIAVPSKNAGSYPRKSWPRRTGPGCARSAVTQRYLRRRRSSSAKNVREYSSHLKTRRQRQAFALDEAAEKAAAAVVFEIQRWVRVCRYERRAGH